MSTPLNLEANSGLVEHVDTFCNGVTPTLPGAIVHVADRTNSAIFSYASGGRPYSSLSRSTQFKVHSVTKIFGAVAFMQLVERGLVSLDDPQVIKDLLPELYEKKVLVAFDPDTKDAVFEDREGSITPRMLMNHTNGTGSSFFNSRLHAYLMASYNDWETVNEASDAWGVIMRSPLVSQPGTKTEYGVGFDWLAVLIKRLLKNQTLEDHMKKHIFQPLGMTGTGYEGQYGGDVAVEGRFWPRQLKVGEGVFVAMEDGQGNPLSAHETEEELKAASNDKEGGKNTFHPLGSGLISTAEDLTRFFTTIFLNRGTDPTSGNQILSARSVDEIIKPQIPESLRNRSRSIPSAVPALVCPIDLGGASIDPEGSYGFGCAVQGQVRRLEGVGRGRGKGSVYWFGAANTEWWADIEAGIVGVMTGNYFPWNERAWLEFTKGMEERIYGGL